MQDLDAAAGELLPHLAVGDLPAPDLDQLVGSVDHGLRLLGLGGEERG